MRILHSQRVILISKPRSGSTSLRRTLDPYVGERDVVCNTPHGMWHPHHTALRLSWIFRELEWPFNEYTKICTARNPYELVSSYYKYFKPDKKGRYFYESGYDSDTQMPFRDWLLTGKIWDQTYLQQGKDLRSISIDSYCFDDAGHRLVDHIVDLDNHKKLHDVLAAALGDSTIRVPHTNKSEREARGLKLEFDKAMDDKIREMFWREFELFGYRRPAT